MVGFPAALLFLASPASPAQDPRSATSTPRPPADASQPDPTAELRYTRVERLPKAITLAHLSNGLTVIVQENHVARVATVRCYVKNTGSAYEGKWLGAGVSHVLEHVVAGGSTTKRNEREIQQLIDTFGGATNAYTSTNLTAFFIDSPARNVMTAIELVADSMQYAKFEPAEFNRELKVVRRELADGEVNRGRVLQTLLGQTVYQEHPARHPVIGYLDVLNATTNQTIIDFYRQRYVPNNQVFVVVGDVDTQAVLDQVLRQWKGTPHGYATPTAFPSEPLQMAPREAVQEMDGATYDLALAWPTVDLAHPDLYALDLAEYILAEGDSSRLVQRLKYERQLVLSVSASSYTPSFVRGWFGVFAVARPQQFPQATTELLREVYRLREELVDPAELAKAKKQKAAELVFESQTVQQAAERLGQNYLSTSDPLFQERYVTGIQRVTAEQIRDAARRWLVPERLNRIVIAPPGGAPKAARRKTANAETPVTLTRLPNGLRVLVKRQAQLPLVNVQAFVLGGSLVDTPDTAGRSGLVAAMLDRGTAQHSARQIAEYFDSIGGRISFAAGRNTIYGSSSVLREDFPRAFSLFAECFLHPVFPEEEFQRVKQLTLGAIARRADSPHQEAFELFYDSLPVASPYHLLEGGKTETVERLTVGALKAYQAKYFHPEKMIVSVFGDVTPDDALKLVEQHFGTLKPSVSETPITFDRLNALPETIVRHKQIRKPTGMVVIGYPAPSIFQKEDYAALALLDAIMSGYSYPGGWLHTELRGEGLVYFVHALPMSGPVPGYFVAVAQTQPDKVDEVVRRILKNFERAKAGQISPEEFRVAQQMVVALHAEENTTLADQARLAALDELYGLGYNYDQQFDARIEAVKLDDVVRVARTYLKHYVQVTTAPNGK
jgi:zinc protease